MKRLTLRPRSFSGLIFACLLGVAVPLIVPLIYGAESINQLSKQWRQTVHQVEQIERYSKVLVHQTEKMERSIKLSHILNDASMLEGYYQSRSKFREALAGLSVLPLSGSQMTLLEQVDASEAGLFSQIGQLPAGHKASSHLRIDFAGLQDAVNEFLSRSYIPVERKMDTMQAMADEAGRITIWLVILMIPFAMLLAFSVSRLITAPIQQINGAIQAMGNGELSRSVKIDGPQDLQRLGEKLEWLRLSLLELEKQKTTFLQHVSHELKTPLTSIREGAGLLSEGIAGRLTDKQNEIAAILLANSIQLQKRIEDLLDFNALLTGKTVLAQKAVALRPVIAGVIQDHRLVLENKALKIELLCPDCTIQGDEQKLRIVVDNLLSNAIKYSARGGSIEINVVQTGDGMQIDVIDFGPGVAAEDRERIFGAFYQGRNLPQGGTVKGTGLGLAIAREYVLAHGGRIQLVEQAAGSCFRVSLPVNPLAASA